MKKIIFLISCLFLISGCQAEYTVSFDGTNIKEKMIINSNDQEEIDLLKAYKENNTAFIDDQISSETNEKIEGIEYYEMLFVDNSLNFKYNFKNSNYSSSNIVNTCYKSFNFVDKKDNFTLATSKEFMCFNLYPDLEKVTVKVIVDYDNLETNADQVEGNIYTWVLDKNNSDNSIYMHSNKTNIDDDKDDSGSDKVDSDSSEEVINKDDENNFIYVLGGLTLFLIIIFVMFKIKK